MSDRVRRPGRWSSGAVAGSVAAAAVVGVVVAVAVLGLGVGRSGGGGAGAGGGGGVRDVRTVRPVLETEVFPSGTGDVADDSAVWFDRSDPENSAVVADNKATDGGLAVYDLAGRTVSYLPAGMIGNVDLREGFPLGDRRVVLVGANDRTDDSIRFWTLDPATRTLTAVSAPVPTLGPNYGFCLYASARTGEWSAFVTERAGGRMEQYLLDGTSGTVTARKVRSFDVGSQSEGCVADDVSGRLYVGEEDVGIWRYGAEPGDGSRRVAVDRAGDGRLTADVEGLELVRGGNGPGFLLASSQGDSTVAVYAGEGDNAYLGSVRVGAAGDVDGVTDTDGIAGVLGDVGAGFGGGLLVVHDNANEGSRTSNLKYVRLADVLGAVGAAAG